MDNVDDRVRSRIMGRIRSSDTAPELRLRRALHRAGARYRVHVRGLPGTPDIAFPKQRVAVFVHGCFWHRHPVCKLSYTPKSRPAFWQAKFAANQRRDHAQIAALDEAGWRTITVWACALDFSMERVVSAVLSFRTERGLHLVLG